MFYIVKLEKEADFVPFLHSIFSKSVNDIADADRKTGQIFLRNFRAGLNGLYRKLCASYSILRSHAIHS